MIGAAVLDALRKLDEVAYLRFASVYKSFDDVADFQREASLLAKSARVPGAVTVSSRLARAGRVHAAAADWQQAASGAVCSYVAQEQVAAVVGRVHEEHRRLVGRAWPAADPLRGAADEPRRHCQAQLVEQPGADELVHDARSAFAQHGRLAEGLQRGREVDGAFAGAHHGDFRRYRPGVDRRDDDAPAVPEQVGGEVDLELAASRRRCAGRARPRPGSARPAQWPPPTSTTGATRRSRAKSCLSVSLPRPPERPSTAVAPSADATMLAST